MGRGGGGASSYQDGPGDMLRVHCSWLRKLELTKQLLVDQAEGKLPDDDALAYSFIYLQVWPHDFAVVHLEDHQT